jgi:hypothetical protein
MLSAQNLAYSCHETAATPLSGLLQARFAAVVESWLSNAELTGSFRVYGYNRMRAARRRYSYTGVKHGETEEGAINRCN